MEFMIGLQEAATTTTEATASNLQLWGAFCFGAVIGWYVYYVNRYRSGEVKFSDLSTLISIIGGGAILTLFPASTDLFGAYGVGLATGFFVYFIVLIIFVGSSSKFKVDWFLDGRRGELNKGEFYGPGNVVRETVTAMSDESSSNSRSQ